MPDEYDPNLPIEDLGDELPVNKIIQVDYYDNDDGFWNEYIKKGKVKGFSVEGNFIMNFSRQDNDEYLLQEIINIIKQIND